MMQSAIKRFIGTLIIFVSIGPLTYAYEKSNPLASSGWKLWLDRNAEWKNDPLFLSPFNLQELPVNPPTCGWNNLFATSVPLSEVEKIISNPLLSVEVNVPGTVEEFCWDALSGQAGGLGNSGDYEGVSWWGKEFTVPQSATNKRIKLYFSGGIRQRAEVFVNEKLVGYELVHQTPFEIDITDAVKIGHTNKLAVRITDANGNFSWGDYTGTLWGKYYFPLSHGFGGILDKVEVKILNPVHVSDVFVKNKPSLTDIDVELELSNEDSRAMRGNISVEIVEAWKNNKPVTIPQTIFNKTIGTFNISSGSSGVFNFSASVPQARLWNIKDANLYYLVVTLKDNKGKVIDQYTRRFGFRFLEVEGYGSDARFYFNGKRTFMLTAISWGYWPVNGMFPTPQLARKHIESAQALGMNMINFHRCMGNSLLLNLADEMGILMYEEPGGHSSSRTKNDNPAVAQAENFELATRLTSQRFLRMVKAHRNHPSLVIYNMINEPGWNPDKQNKRDMAEAHKIDPTRLMTYGSGFMNPQKDEPHKLHMLPYDPVQRTKGYVDIHNAGNSPGVYTDVMYNSPSDYWRNDISKDEIFIWGEEGALASPPQLEMIQEHIRQNGYNGWDGADYKDWYKAYTEYIDRKGLKKYYPSITGLITSLGDIMYYEHGRLIENVRIADGTEVYALNGYEDMKQDNLSGAVDVYRNLKGTPDLINQYMRPLMVAVKVRDKIGHTGDTNLMDLYVLNEHVLPAGEYQVKAQVKKPDGSVEELFSDLVKIAGGDTFSDFVTDQIPVNLDAGKGYYHIAAQLLDKTNKELATGHDEILAVDWQSTDINGKGAILGGNNFLRFSREAIKSQVIPYEDSLGKLDYIVAGEADNGNKFKTLSPAATRTKDGKATGLSMEYYRGTNFEQLLDTRLSTAGIDFNLDSKPIPGWDILGRSNFSLRWEGFIEAEVTGLTQFSVAADDGVRIWFDNKLVVDHWKVSPNTTHTFETDLKAGKKYSIKIEAFQNEEGWLLSFQWRLPVIQKKYDIEALLNRVSQDGTTLLLLGDAQTWIKQFREMNVWPDCKIFHPAKTWVGHNFFVRQHPFFDDLPVNGGMNWEYQSLVVYDGPLHFGLYDMEGEEAVVSLVGGPSHLISTSIGIVPHGKGKIVFSSLDLDPNLMKEVKASHVPKKIYCNMLQWAANPINHR